MEMMQRPRRLRRLPVLRQMVRETRVSPGSLIYPIFVREGSGICEEIPSLPGQFRYSPDTLLSPLERLLESGVNKVLLFGIPQKKDPQGSGAWAENGVVQQALREAKRRFPELYCVTDVCLCEYTSHGHCGLLCGEEVENDATVELLARTALSHVQAGADMVAPSDMMDGRVGQMRRVLDANGFTAIPILSYSAKYASSFYGPFREAAGSAPAFGDRKAYQMDYHNSREALWEVRLDEEEGADLVMVKPALSYLDIIARVRQETDLPLAAYSVSGEYAMIKAAAAQGLVDEAAIACETAVSIYRAGADILISYYAPQLAGWMKEGRIG